MKIGLPNEPRRPQIRKIYTVYMRNNKKIAADVDSQVRFFTLKFLLQHDNDVWSQESEVLMKNLSGAEIEGLLDHCLQRLIKSSNKVEIHPKTDEKLMVDYCDFSHALET